MASICPRCDKQVSTRGGLKATLGRVRICYVGFVHRSCFHMDKDKFFTLSIAKAIELGKYALPEKDRPHGDITDWLEYDFEQPDKLPWQQQIIFGRDY